MSKIVQQLNFSGRRVLVTGGGKGIGRAIVHAFLELGATVIVFDKDEASLKDLKDKLDSRDHGDRVQIVHVDLSDWEAARRATESVLPVHHLINNAGTMRLNDFLEITEQEVNSLFDINFKTALNVGQVVAKGMIQNDIEGGTIVNMSSTADSTGYKRQGVHAATKAALTSLTKTMANELGQFGIRINCVRPSLVNTELVASLPPQTLRGLTDYFYPRSAMPGLIESSEVANVVVFLSSPMSAKVTGAPLSIDAGFGTS